MTPGLPISPLEIPTAEFAEASELELRDTISQVDRKFLRADCVDLRGMSDELSAAEWASYTAMCRALRAKVRQNGPRKS